MARAKQMIVDVTGTDPARPWDAVDTRLPRTTTTTIVADRLVATALVATITVDALLPATSMTVTGMDVRHPGVVARLMSMALLVPATRKILMMHGVPRLAAMMIPTLMAMAVRMMRAHLRPADAQQALLAAVPMRANTPLEDATGN